MQSAVTVVIPAYKARDRIAKAIGSVIGEPLVDRVIVVVDDQCADTADFARSLGATVIVNDRNLGASASRNRGLAAVETPYVFFLDSDDWIEPPLLDGLVAASERDQLDLCFGPYVVVIDSTGVRLQPPALPHDRTALFQAWMVDNIFVPPCAVLWRTEALRRFGGWNEAISRQDDAELVLRAILLGAAFAFSSEGLGIYLWHQSPYRVSKQSSRIADSLTMLRGLLALPEPAIRPEAVRHAAGMAAYETARVAFVEGQFGIGREALRYARSLGFSGHRGGAAARLVGHLFGLEGRMRVMSLLLRARHMGKTAPREK